MIHIGSTPFGLPDSVSAGQGHDHNCKPLTCGFPDETIMGRPEAPSISPPGARGAAPMIDNERGI